jgi:hypothetical protein
MIIQWMENMNVTYTALKDMDTMCEERTGNRIVSVISDKFGAETRTQSLVYKFRLVR